MATDGDFEAAGLLEGLEGEHREARRRLLRKLDDAGFTIEELQDQHAQDLLPFALAEREVTGPLTYAQGDIAEASGVDLEVLQGLRRAQGLPLPEVSARVFGEGDLELARTMRGLLDAGVPPERLREVSRLLGRGLQPVAELMRATALEQSFDPDLPEDELAERFRERAAVLLPFIAPSLVGAMRVQLREMVAVEAAALIERRGGSQGGQPVVVAFADLSGFTRLGEQLDPGGLGEVAEKLATLLGQCARPGVRVVKELGDGAMLVCPEPAPLVETGLDLVDAAEREELPALRVGVAAGKAIPRAGDWFGRPVNLASRICGAARPASVLTTREVRDAIGDDLHWSSAGSKKLKGVEGPVRLYRARRPGDDGNERD